MTATACTKMIIGTSVGNVTLRKRGRLWYARKQVGAARYEIPLKTDDLKAAEDIAQQVMPARVLGIQDLHCAGDGIPTDADYKRLFSKARARAKTNRVEYSLTADDERKIMRRSGGACELTGVIFSKSRTGTSFRAPLLMSLDRIDPNVGYTQGNVRLVCVAVNWALSDWGIGIFDKICSAYCAKKLLGSGAKVESTFRNSIA